MPTINMIWMLSRALLSSFDMVFLQNLWHNFPIESSKICLYLKKKKMKCIAVLLSDYSLNCYSFQVHFILQSFLINHKFIYATLSICFCHYLHFHVKHILCRFRLSCIQSRRNLPWRLYWRYYCIDDHICLFCAFPEAFNVFPSIAYQKRKKKKLMIISFLNCYIFLPDYMDLISLWTILDRLQSHSLNILQ